ncbi:reverse transcriptase [Gossypium australe]|uniref:Reverse transcriptase n=1 Tax=Gossypium australe TaxID=47621 RepID=A0A5B6VRR4_9ROSI|nr:reverse transcriptase [Gossypium australe]
MEDWRWTADLIDSNTRKWKTDLIINTFEEREAERILCIPLPLCSFEDFVVWNGEPTGEYSRIMGSANCRRCQTEAETREHLFRDCPVAKDTWERLAIAWPNLAANMDFSEVLKKIFEANSLGICRKFVCALWGIWTARNKFLHEGKMQTGSQIVDFFVKYMRELDGTKRFLPESSFHRNRWIAPSGSRLKINFDAAFNRQRKESCTGLIVRNGNSEVICSRSIINKNIPSAFAAEALACYQALELGVQLGLRDVEVEGDSQTVIRKLQEENEDRSEIATYIADSKKMTFLFISCVFLFQNREANEEAQK